MMNRILLFIFFVLSLFSASKVHAQVCPPCPPFFTVSDSTNCNRVEIRKNIQGQPYTTLNDLKACKNSIMTYILDANPTCYPVINYSLINIAGGTVLSFSTNQFTVQWSNANTASIFIGFVIPGGSNGPGCQDTIRINYNLLNNPVAAFTASPQPACFNNPTNISFNSSASLNATNYFWDFGDGFNSTLANPVHAYSSPGTYTVTLIVSNTPAPAGGSIGVPTCPTCVDSVKQTITIDNLPGPPITCVASICAGGTETYCTSASGCSQYNWTVIGGTITGGQNTPCVTVNWGSGNPQGSINLSVTGCNTNYCPQGTTVSIPIIPTTTNISGDTIVCINSVAGYTLPSFPGTVYNWSLSGGGSFNPYNTNTNQVNVGWNTLGTYTLSCSYFDSALNCGGTASINVHVLPVMFIKGPVKVCQGQNSTLNSVYSPNVPVASNWTFSPAGPTINSGNGTSSVNINWPAAGTYTVTATPVSTTVVCGPASYTVMVLPTPVISSINGPDTICANQTYVYTASASTTGLFTWNVTNGTATLLGVNNDSVQVTWGAAGPYSISVSLSSIPNNCVSNTFSKTIYTYPVPVVSGPLNVCADNTNNYTITNIANGNFQWYVYPSAFGTILTGQGSNTVQIKWFGNNNPGFPNTVHLHYGICSDDSVAIVINEPQAANITATGNLCSGVTLSTGATGSNFSWSCTEHPIVPTPGNTSSISGITLPGHYSVVITNYNGTGCTVTANYFLSNAGLPVAHISASGPLVYCVAQSLPNMLLVADSAAGYSFQWYMNNSPVGTGSVLPVNTLNTPGTYVFYCAVTLGGCTVNSNQITVVIQNCPPPNPPGPCDLVQLGLTIAGCNPFTITASILSPGNATLVGNMSITHAEDNTTVNSNTTHVYSSTGYKHITVCVDVQLFDNTICRVCKDTVVLVTVAPKFISNLNCGIDSLVDASSTIFPAVISGYSWSVGTNPGNSPVPPVIASFNNSSIANPVLTFTQSGSYIITQTIKSGSCMISYMDTVNVSVPDADFNIANSCVGTAVSFNNLFAAPNNFWDFGDAAVSYTSPTLHAYSAPNTYLVTHIVTDANGCVDTVKKNIVIIPAPTCSITYTSPLTFCQGDSVILKGCAGYTNYQWYNNGVLIPGQTGVNDTVYQTGNYSFIASDINGCKVVSDTVTVTVLQAPNVTIYSSGSTCAGSNYTVTVPSCVGCMYMWTVDNVPVGNSNSYSGTSGNAPFTTGTHIITAIVTNSLGCTDSSSVTVQFNPLPSISIAVAGNPAQLCSNNIYSFTASSNASNPSWAWYFGNVNFILSTTPFLSASSAGNYTVYVTDGITGCKNSTIQSIDPSPELNLFPIGCDTLCDTSHIYIPLASLNGNLSGYTIDWYDNAPPYTNYLGSGISLALNVLTPGAHNISVIVTAPNGCKDSSDVYSIEVKSCLNVIAVQQIEAGVKQAGNYALLNWQTDHEWDNDHFIIERSDDGIRFVYAGKTYSKGNSNHWQYYQFNDPLVRYGQPVYYRVKMVFRNGHTAYSSIVRLLPEMPTGESLLVLPNLVRDRVSLVINCNSNGKSVMEIYSATGKLAVRNELTLTKGINTIPYSMNRLPAGLYYVVVRTPAGRLTSTFVKQ